MKILITLAMALGFIPAFAQQEVLIDTVPTTDGFYQANNLEEAVPFAYAEVNMKNIRFYKRVWRDIDLKDEKNALLATPGNSLMEIIMKSIETGKLSLYSPDDDSFKGRMSAKDGVARFTDSVLVPIFDDEGNQIDSKMTLNEFDPSRVTKFRIKEDIFFDKQRSRLESRIIGVAPLMNITTSSELAETVGSTPAFWLYFPQLRYSLVKVDITDPDKGLYDMTMDDLFVQKKYASTIVRESSAGALKLGDEAQQMQDAQQIEQKIDAYKKKLWTSPKGVKDENLEEFIPNAQKQKKAKKK
jgi:gliding motility associated protien GldN